MLDSDAILHWSGMQLAQGEPPGSSLTSMLMCVFGAADEG